MIDRRGFLASLAALMAAPFIPAPKPVAQSLMFHPNAFEFMMPPFSRMDIIYGVGTLQPQFACRIWDEPNCLHASENYRKYLAADAAIQAAL